MKVMILQTAYKKAEDYGTFYNVQELGLARALADKGHEVILYKALDGVKEPISEYDGRLTSVFMNVRYIGINGLIDVTVLDKTADALIYFCDTQIKVASVYKWCKKNNVRFYPYVGVVESHSEKFINRLIMGVVARQDLRIYRKCTCLVKTPDMFAQLIKRFCKDVVLFPVGLDTTILHNMNEVCESEYEKGADNHKVKRLLYVGRMEEEKHPLEMVDIFRELVKEYKELSLTMIGDGYMYDQTREAIDTLVRDEYLNEGQVTLLRKVPYNEMYKYYMDADLYINLNRVEILGMSILEAMYYGCGVVAVEAPGPTFLLNDGDKNVGIIADDKNGVVAGIKYYIDEENYDVLSMHKKAAYEKVCREFCWNALANMLIDIIR